MAYVRQRILMAIMGFLALVNGYTMRISFSILMTEIVEKINHTGTESKDVCSSENNGKSMQFDFKEDEKNADGLYIWSEQLQGFILSSFYWGYLIAHIPGGVLADKFGCKWTLAVGICSTTIFTAITPTAIKMGGSKALIILRILMGLGEGTIFPALSVLLAKWIPLRERGIFGALVFGGGQIGSVLGNGVSGILLDRFHSWELVFYVWASVAFIWLIFWIIFCYNDPASHPFITDKEKEYLLAEIGTIERKKNPTVPWKAMFTSMPVMALICSQVGHDWGFFIMSTDLPKYMSDVLKLPVKENGLFTALPYAFMWTTSILAGLGADCLITRNILSITNSRKMFTILAAMGPAIFLVLASYSGCDVTLAVIYFTIGMAFMGLWYGGMKLTVLDISPNFAGTLMAFANGTGSLAGAIAPIFVGYITPNARLDEWRTVFWVTFGVFLVTSIFITIWASGEIQPWDDPDAIPAPKAEK